MIVHMSGEFALESPLEFSPKDSGAGENNVVYKGDGKTVIHGGKKVTGWQAVEGTPFYQTTLDESLDFRQMYVNNNRAQRAKSKWFYYAKGEFDDASTTYSFDGYRLNAEDFGGDFSKPEYMEMVWFPSWRVVRAPIKSMTKTDGEFVVRLKESFLSTSVNSSAPVKGHPFILENAPEFLDEPGEFYFDKETKVLTYYPKATENMNSSECFIPVSEGIVKLEGSKDEKVRNIRFEGIEFKYGAWERPTENGFSTIQAEQLMTTATEKANGKGTHIIIPAQIQADYAENITFSKNEFSHLGSVAVGINKTSENIKVEGNIFDDISSGAVTIGDWNITSTSQLEDYVRNINVCNNLIRRTSVEYMTPIITGYYVNNVLVDHNDILDAPYTGVSMGWGWGNDLPYSKENKITNNKIENVLYRLKDGGHIYTLSKNDGGIISGNYLVKSGEWKGGIYLDNGSKNMTIEKNVFDCFKWLKITWHNITGNVAKNNWSETPMAVKNMTSNADFKDVDLKTVNTLEEANGKVNGVWGEVPQAIIDGAGLSPEYESLLSKYAARGNAENDAKEIEPSVFGGEVIWAGDYIKEANVGYYDIAGDNTTKRGTTGEPQVDESYDGTGALSVSTTTQGEWTKYKFNAEKDGTYDIYANLGVNTDIVYVGVSVDGGQMKNVYVSKNSQNSSYDTRSDYLLGSFDLTKGEHTITIKHALKNFWFYHLKVSEQGKVYSRDDGFIEAYMDKVK